MGFCFLVYLINVVRAVIYIMGFLLFLLVYLMVSVCSFDYKGYIMGLFFLLYLIEFACYFSCEGYITGLVLHGIFVGFCLRFYTLGASSEYIWWMSRVILATGVTSWTSPFEHV